MYIIETKHTEYITSVYSNFIPRIGEEIIISKEEGDSIYLVENVIYKQNNTRWDSKPVKKPVEVIVQVSQKEERWN